jgi:outer membrane protein TolC
MNSVKWFCLCLALCAPRPGAGQPALSLDSCLVLALRNSPGLRSAENAVRAAGLARSELGTTVLPQIQAVIDAIYIPVPPRYGYDPAITDGGEVRGLISLRQSVYDSGLRTLKSDQFSADIERLGNERRLAALDLALAVKQSFYESLRGRAEVGLQKESVDQLEGYLSLVRRLYNGGSASSTDLLKSELQTSSARIALAKAREASLSALIALEEVMGVAPDTSVTLTGSLDEVPGPPADSAAADGFDPAATLDMAVAGMLVRHSVLDEDIARHERLPDISLFADAGYLTSGDNLRLPSSQRVNGMGYEVGLGIQFPILNWGATGLRTEQREVATDDLRNRMELLRRSIASDAVRLRVQIAGARERLLVLRGNRAKANDNFILTKSKFAAGASLSLEVLAAQQALTDAHLAEIQTMEDIRLMAAKMERLNARPESAR